MKFRLSFINFLNSVPLGWSFLNGHHRDVFELSFDVPSECARRLANGRADVGLIPVIEYQNIEGLRVLPDISISSKREVKSVLFVSNVALSEVRRIAVDTSSRTSVALLKILFQVFYRRDSVSFEPLPPQPDMMLQSHDAALIIGNPALKMSLGSREVYDLAGEWYRFTGLPFVFAFWAARPGVDLGQQAALFYQSKREGLGAIQRIGQLYSQKLGLAPADIEAYILRNLDYSLDEANLRGLRTFYRLAAEIGLIPAAKGLQFYPNLVPDWKN
ncbi:MAG: menaquinone biosynthetic enzyme MqnA/MqnD family protein [Acidobacteriota bacterium]